MQQTLEQPKSGKSLIKQIFIALGVFFALIIVAGYFFLRLQFEPSLFRQPFYRLSHQVFSVQDIGHSYPSREVAIALSTSENPNPKEEAFACVKAFEIRSLQDGQRLTCRVFFNKPSYQKYLDGNKSCVLATAIQGPYAKAKDAEVTMYTGALCDD